MAEVYLSIGTNIDREAHLIQAKTRLMALFGAVHYSSIYESKAVGFIGDPFYNLVAKIETDLDVGLLSERLKQIEDECGRDRNAPKYSGRTLDIDLLTYDQLTGTVAGVELPRAEILHQAFVLQPMAEIAPQRVHPVAHQSYQQLWESYAQQHENLAEPSLWKVSLSMDELAG